MTRNLKNEKRFYCFIEILRALACILITNSHFDGVYPLNISWGGCPGNCLFFILTGFLLTTDDYENVKFSTWYLNKIIRLYIPLTIMNIVNVFVGYRKPSLELFLFPINRYWFIPVIVILYFLLYFIMKYYKKYRMQIILLDLTIYIAIYYLCFNRKEFFVERHFYFLILYGLIAMVFGSYIRENLQSIMKFSLKKSLFYFLLSIGGVIGFLGMKLWIETGAYLALELQFLTQVSSLLFAVSILLGIPSQERLCIKVINNNVYGKIIKNLGTATLEIYLVQYVIINDFRNIVSFPFNFIFLILFIYFAGLLLKLVDKKIINNLIRGIYA